MHHIGRAACKMKMKIAVTLLALVFTASLYGQNPRGSLRGLVQDSTGARVASASIEIRVAESSILRRASSDAHGQFFVQDLPVGRCEITVSADKFAPASAEVLSAVSTIRDVVILPFSTDL